MKSIFVFVKQVPDTEAKLQLNGEKTGVNTSSVKFIMNPYDEFAIEEAVQWKEKSSEELEIIALTIGPARADEVLRTALAMGADKAFRLDPEDKQYPYDLAPLTKIVAGFIQKQSQDILAIFMGKSSIDITRSCFGIYLAHHLNLPCLSFVSKIEKNDTGVKVHRELEGGIQEIATSPFPVVITTTKGLNQPRYINLPGIMKAKKKPLEVLKVADLDSLNIDGTYFSTFETPSERPPVEMIEGEDNVSQLVHKLKNEAKIL